MITSQIWPLDPAYCDISGLYCILQSTVYSVNNAIVRSIISQVHSKFSGSKSAPLLTLYINKQIALCIEFNAYESMICFTLSNSQYTDPLTLHSFIPVNTERFCTKLSYCARIMYSLYSNSFMNCGDCLTTGCFDVRMTCV